MTIFDRAFANADEATSLTAARRIAQKVYDNPNTAPATRAAARRVLDSDNDAVSRAMKTGAAAGEAADHPIGIPSQSVEGGPGAGDYLSEEAKAARAAAAVLPPFAEDMVAIEELLAVADLGDAAARLALVNGPAGNAAIQQYLESVERIQRVADGYLAGGQQAASAGSVVQEVKSRKRRKGIPIEYGLRETEADTSSPEAQVAMLTKRISELSEHLIENEHDHHRRRGLLLLRGRRRRLLKYLEHEDVQRYRSLIQRLGLRR